MPESIIFVTARRISPNAGKDLTQPKRYPVSVVDIKDQVTNTKRGGAVLKFWDSAYKAKKVETFESINQIKTLISPASTEFAPEFATLNALGANQGAAALLASFLTKVGTITGGSAEGFRLPVAVAGAVFQILNPTAVTLKLYPATGQFIQNKAGTTLAANASIDVLAGQTISIAVKPGSTTTWQVAID